MRKRQIKAWGDSLAISLPKNDVIDLELEKGDAFDLTSLKTLETVDGRKRKPKDKKPRIRYVSKWGKIYAILIQLKDVDELDIKKGDLIDLDSLKLFSKNKNGKKK